jgi:hypothetical protein
MFDNRVPPQSVPYGLNATHLWVTNSYPLGFSFKEDRHAWVNHGTEMCRILFVLMDSKQP